MRSGQSEQQREYRTPWQQHEHTKRKHLEYKITHRGQDYSLYLSASDGTDDGSFLVLVAQALTSKVSRTAIGELDDDGRLDVTGSFKSSIDGAIDNGGQKNCKSVGWLDSRESPAFSLGQPVSNREACIYLVEVQLMAGIANLCSRANRDCE